MQTKKLTTIPDPEKLDGFSYIYGRKAHDIYVNIQRLWERAVKTANKRVRMTPEDYFCKWFCNTYTHEVLHFVLRKFYRPALKWELGEEHVIWNLMGEKMPKVAERYYNKDCGKTCYE